MLSIFFTN
jgi:hypothetical protein